MAGMEASTMTSLGTWRLVMPRSESTMASAGPSASSASKAALMAVPSGSESSPVKMAPSPSFGLRPAAVRVSPYRANVSGKKARTTWPKMIGSEIFIMVALRCTENSTPSALARSIWVARNCCSAATRMTEASTTSPAKTGTAERRTVIVAVVTDQLDTEGTGLGHHGRPLGGAEVAARPCGPRWSSMPATMLPSGAGGSGRSS